MRANISDELLNKINDKIYIDLEIHALTKRMNKSDNEGFKKYLDNIIVNLIKQRKQIHDFLNQENVKVYEVVEDDDKQFVEYHYSVKINGGYKEGTMRYWRYAIRFGLKKRLSKYFGGD